MMPEISAAAIRVADRAGLALCEEQQRIVVDDGLGSFSTGHSLPPAEPFPSGILRENRPFSFAQRVVLSRSTLSGCPSIFPAGLGRIDARRKLFAVKDR